MSNEHILDFKQTLWKSADILEDRIRDSILVKIIPKKIRIYEVD